MTAFMPDVFDRMSRDPRWLGFGYLGGRRNHLNNDDPECGAGTPGRRQERVAYVDQRVREAADAKGWTDEDLFAWANSKHGRWLADAAFGDGGSALDLALGTWNLLTVP